MKRKPTSIADFLKTVAFVKCPDLLPTDRYILLCLSLYADANTGRRAHPGVSNLAEMTGLSARYVQKRLRVLEASVLVCEACAKGGRGMAAEYRVKLESDVFVAEEGRERVSSSSPFTSEKGVLQDSKGCPTEHERVNSDAQKGVLQFTPSDSSSENPSNPPSERNSESGRKDVSNPKPAAMESERKTQAEEFFGKDFDLMGEPNEAQRKQVKELGEKESPEHPWELMKETMRRFKLRPKGFGELRDPWLWFLREAPKHIAVTKDDSWWQQKYDPEYMRIVEESIRRGREQDCRINQLPVDEPEPELFGAPF